MIRILMNGTLLLIGLIAGILLTSLQPTDWTALPDGQYPGSAITGVVTAANGVPERPSPKDRIAERDIAVYGDRVVLDLQGAQWSTFTDTNSMDPVIDQGANAIQVVPESPDDIQVGDIISYGRGDDTIIHRVIQKGEDEDGPYFIAQGDNLATSDPGRIRFDQIKRVVVAIIY